MHHNEQMSALFWENTCSLFSWPGLMLLVCQSSASLSYTELWLFILLPIAAMMLLVISSGEITEGSFRLTHS